MSEEYEIIFITEEGRAIKNNKTGKIYHSEFEIIEEKNKEINRLNNIINELEEIINYEIEKWQNTDDELMKARVQEDNHILDVIQELKDSD